MEVSDTIFSVVESIDRRSMSRRDRVRVVRLTKQENGRTRDRSTTCVLRHLFTTLVQNRISNETR